MRRFSPKLSERESLEYTVLWQTLKILHIFRPFFLADFVILLAKQINLLIMHLLSKKMSIFVSKETSFWDSQIKLPLR